MVRLIRLIIDDITRVRRDAHPTQMVTLSLLVGVATQTMDVTARNSEEPHHNEGVIPRMVTSTARTIRGTREGRALEMVHGGRRHRREKTGACGATVPIIRASNVRRIPSTEAQIATFAVWCTKRKIIGKEQFLVDEINQGELWPPIRWCWIPNLQPASLSRRCEVRVQDSIRINMRMFLEEKTKCGQP